MINIVTTPRILTDDIFFSYVTAQGNATGTADQRQAAYAIAEGQAVSELGTFVAPTTITGTYPWPPMGQPLQLQHTQLSGVLGVTAIHDAGCDCAEDATEIAGCAWIMDADGGLVSLRECDNTAQGSCAGCQCGYGFGNGPLQARIAYTAGLPTGAALDPRLLMALSTAADLSLQQIVDMFGAEGGAGDPGIESYRSLSYSEKRTDASVRMTAFGNSARANYAASILRGLSFKRALKLGW